MYARLLRDPFFVPALALFVATLSLFVVALALFVSALTLFVSALVLFVVNTCASFQPITPPSTPNERYTENALLTPSPSSPDYEPGDVVLRVRSRKEAGGWRRKESSLYWREVVGVGEALLGFERNLTHLDGHVVTLRREGVTQPGE